MSYSHLLLVSVVAMILTGNVTSRTWDQEVEDRSSIEREIEELESQIKALESRIAALKAILGDKPDAEPDPADAARPVKLYGSAQEILLELPAELKPQLETGWDKFTIGKVSGNLFGGA